MIAILDHFLTPGTKSGVQTTSALTIVVKNIATASTPETPPALIFFVMHEFPAEDPSELIEGIREGQSGVLEQVFDQYFGHLVNYARRLLKNCQSAADGEDAAISAMRTFLRRVGEGEFDSLANQNELFRLLTVIVVRKSLNHRRKDRRMHHLSAIEDPSHGVRQNPLEHPAQQPEIEQIAIVHETLEQLFDGLHTETSRSIVLMQLEGFSNSIIAERLRVSIRTVERQIGRIRSVLQSIEAHESSS